MNEICSMWQVFAYCLFVIEGILQQICLSLFKGLEGAEFLGFSVVNNVEQYSVAWHVGFE